MIWTSIIQNILRAQSPEGEIQNLAELTSINSLAYRENDGKLFVT